MANWANDLARGFGQGDVMARAIGDRAATRKKEKLAGIIAKEQDDKLFTVEDKGAVGNFLWDKLGIGDAPTKTPKSGAVATPGPAAEPASPARATVAAGMSGLAAGSETAPAPEPLPMADIAVTPVRAPTFAAATPLVAAPQMSPVEPQPSALRKMLQEQGIKV